MSDLNPQPKSWPECSDCRTAYVLRRVLVFHRDGRKFAIDSSWVWQYDCKHRKAPAVVRENGKPKRAAPKGRK
jgi:hypothetical protein